MTEIRIAPLKKGIPVPRETEAALRVLMPYFPRSFILPAIVIEMAAAGFGYMFGRGAGALSASSFETIGLFETHSLDYLPAMSASIGAVTCMFAVVLAYHVVRRRFRDMLRSVLDKRDHHLTNSFDN